MADIRLVPGPSATAVDHQDARNAHRILSAEIDSIRAMADNWRKGLAGLLVAVVGFSLIRGRSDLDKLAEPWAIGVAVLLGLTLVLGGIGSYLILAAAHGHPKAVPVATGRRSDGTAGAAVTRHELAMKALSALQKGMIAAVAAMVLLVAAVAITWFGPDRAPLVVEITDVTGRTYCGKVERTERGEITLATGSGPATVDLTGVSALRALGECASDVGPK